MLILLIKNVYVILHGVWNILFYQEMLNDDKYKNKMNAKEIKYAQ